MNIVTVTAENIEDIREILPIDQRKDIEVGCETWGITFGGQSGQITVWPEHKRAAVAYNADSEWGDWNERTRTITMEDGRVIDIDGDEVIEDEAVE